MNYFRHIYKRKVEKNSCCFHSSAKRKHVSEFTANWMDVLISKLMGKIVYKLFDDEPTPAGLPFHSSLRSRCFQFAQGSRTRSAHKEFNFAMF